ncbi:MAG TPA: type VI secretion system contractile sheath small subunit [Flavipsychrobacter sp.]|nr:type VI secretion system contractile sheath small subunit [Flavipsychrobacter sp.]
MFDYQVGGNAVKTDASEGMADIPMNRSLFVQKLTADDPVKPQAVYDLKTVDEVFNHFKPKVEVDFEKQDGSAVSEEIRFNSVGDFKPSAIVGQSGYLQNLSNQKEDYQKVMKQLKTNKLVKNVIENPETKAAFMSALQSLIQELENSK